MFCTVLSRKSEPLNVIIFKLKFSLTDFQVHTVVCDSERMTGFERIKRRAETSLIIRHIADVCDAEYLMETLVLHTQVNTQVHSQMSTPVTTN